MDNKVHYGAFDNTEREDSVSPLPQNGGGDNGAGGDINKRLDKLEAQIEKQNTKFDNLLKDVAEIKGRLTAMPTTWQLVALIFAIMGAAFALIKFGMPLK